MSTKTDRPSVSFSLTVKDSSAALDFYSRAFGAVELVRMPMDDGGIAHAEFKIGDTQICMSDESAEWHAEAMPEGAKASCLFTISVEDCDAAFKKAVAAGGEVLNEPETHFWGMRSGMIRDPFGYRWSMGQVIEELSNDEVMKRAQELFCS